jgi:hypothetical protein
MKKIELKKKIVVNLSDEQKGQIVGGTGLSIFWCAEKQFGPAALVVAQILVSLVIVSFRVKIPCTALII